MSRMKDLTYDIEQLYIEGYSPRSISVMLECPHRSGLWLVGTTQP